MRRFPWFSASTVILSSMLLNAGRILAQSSASVGKPASDKAVGSGSQAEIVVESGHSGTVFNLSFSADGSLMASAGSDGTARLWEVATGKEVRSVQAEDVQVYAVALSPNGLEVATGGREGVVRIWSTETGALLRGGTAPYKFRGIISSLEFSPTGDRLLVADTEGDICSLPMKIGEPVRYKLQEGYADSAVFSDDAKLVLTGSTDGIARLWEASTGEVLKTYEPKIGYIAAVAISHDGKSIATAGKAGVAKLFNRESGTELAALSHPFSVRSVGFTPDGTKLLTLSVDSVYIWDTNTYQQLGRLTNSASASTARITPDGKYVVTGSSFDSGGMALWKVGDYAQNVARREQFMRRYAGIKKEVLDSEFWQRGSVPPLRTFGGTVSRISSLAVSGDGHYLVLSAQADGTARVWNLLTGRQSAVLKGDNRETMNVVAISRDCHLAITGSSNRTVGVWDLASGQKITDLVGASGRIAAVAIAPDGVHIAASDVRGVLSVWAIGGEKPEYQISDPAGSVDAIAWSPDGNHILIGDSKGQVLQLDAKTGAELGNYPDQGGTVHGIAFSEDNKWLVTVSGSQMHFYQAETGKGTNQFYDDLEGAIMSIAFSPDSRWVADGTFLERKVRVRSLVSDDRFILNGHTGSIDALAFTADSRMLFSASDDGTVRVWDLQKHTQLASLFATIGGGWAVVTPDGRFDASNLEGGAPLHWMLAEDPLHTVPLEAFMEQNYTPGLFLRVLDGTLPPNKFVVSTGANLQQPQVTNIRVALSEHMPKRVDITVHASHVSRSDRSSGLRDLRLFRNGQLVSNGLKAGHLDDGDFLFQDVMFPRKGGLLTFSAYAFSDRFVKSNLATITCKVQESAFVKTDRLEQLSTTATGAKQGGPEATFIEEDDDGQVITPECRLTIPFVKPSLKPQPKAFILQIGVDSYADARCNLQFAGNDAIKTADALTKRLGARYLVLQKLLVSPAGGRATGAARDLVRSALREIAKQATPDDLLVMSYSGHGYSSPDGTFYLLPSDISLGTCGGLPPTKVALDHMISATDLAEWLQPVDAGEMTLILDSCYSAESVEAGRFKPGPLGSKGLGQLAYDKRMRILAASQSDAVARELGGALREGLLSYVLVHDGLDEHKADWRPKDGKIAMGEWLSYAEKAVPTFRVPPETTLYGTSGTTQDKKLTTSAQKGASAPYQSPVLFDFDREDKVLVEIDDRSTASPQHIPN